MGILKLKRHFVASVLPRKSVTSLRLSVRQAGKDEETGEAGGEGIEAGRDETERTQSGSSPQDRCALAHQRA